MLRFGEGKVFQTSKFTFQLVLKYVYLISFMFVEVYVGDGKSKIRLDVCERDDAELMAITRVGADVSIMRREPEISENATINHTLCPRTRVVTHVATGHTHTRNIVETHCHPP